MHFPKASDYCGNNTFIKKKSDSSLLCGICDFVCTFPHYRSRFKIRRRVALGSIEEIFLYTENQLYLVGGTNSCSCNVHLNLSFKKRWDFNKRGQKSHTQKNKCSPRYIPKFKIQNILLIIYHLVSWWQNMQFWWTIVEASKSWIWETFKFDTLCIFLC